MQPGFWDIRSKEVHFLSCVCEHRQALQQSRQVFHAAPWGASDPKTCCNDNFCLNIYICNENIQDFELQV
jgi:hypothetical protein